MAITYPRHFPTVHKIRDCEFELVPVVTADPSRGGNAGAVEHGRQVWRASYKTAMLNSAQAGVWSAWIRMLPIMNSALSFRKTTS